VLLWSELKGKKLGYDFHRQKPIDEYIVDFYCNRLSLAIEIDGNSHDDKEIYDEKRQKRLEELGVSVLRFKDFEVTKDIRLVIEKILKWIKEHTPSRKTGPPLWRGE
jgi:very-short-patch-repair endonuclease